MVVSDGVFEEIKNSLENEFLAKIRELNLGEDVYVKIKQVVKSEPPPKTAKKKPIFVPEEKRCLQVTNAGGKCGSAKCDTKCWAHMSKSERDTYIPRNKKTQKKTKKASIEIKKDESEIKKEESEIKKEESEIKKEESEIKKEENEIKKDENGSKKKESEKTS